VTLNVFKESSCSKVGQLSLEFRSEWMWWRILIFHGEYWSFMANIILSWRLLFFHGDCYSFMATAILTWRLLFFHGEYYSLMAMANVILSWRILFSNGNYERRFWKTLQNKFSWFLIPMVVTIQSHAITLQMTEVRKQHNESNISQMPRTFISREA
jgi:hypothetical protein